MLRQITITPVLNGFIVQVGCQTLVFEKLEDLLKNTSAYYSNPDDVEKMFLTQSINASGSCPRVHLEVSPVLNVNIDWGQTPVSIDADRVGHGG